MKFDLVVLENFLEYVKGEVISDVKKIAELIDSEFTSSFIKREKPEPIAPVAPAA